jgi:hypothetical protein
MNQILNGICEIFPDANPDHVSAMRKEVGEIELHSATQTETLDQDCETPED